MANSNGKITAPVTHLDPYRVLSVSPKYGYDVGYICSHPNINKWSMEKPLLYKSPNVLTEDQKKSVNWGIEIPTFYIKDLIAHMSYIKNEDLGYVGDWWSWDELNEYFVLDLTNFNWKYNQPTKDLGKDGYFYRLSDFDNYNHIDPKNPFKYGIVYGNTIQYLENEEKFYLTNIIQEIPEFFEIDISNYDNGLLKSGWLDFSKLRLVVGEDTSLQNCYIGYILLRENMKGSWTTEYIVANTKLSDVNGSYFLTIPKNDLSSEFANYMPIPIISRIQIEETFGKEASVYDTTTSIDFGFLQVPLRMFSSRNKNAGITIYSSLDDGTDSGVNTFYFNMDNEALKPNLDLINLSAKTKKRMLLFDSVDSSVLSEALSFLPIVYDRNTNKWEEISGTHEVVLWKKVTSNNYDRSNNDCSFSIKMRYNGVVNRELVIEATVVDPESYGEDVYESSIVTIMTGYSDINDFNNSNPESTPTDARRISSIAIFDDGTGGITVAVLYSTGIDEYNQPIYRKTTQSFISDRNSQIYGGYKISFEEIIPEYTNGQLSAGNYFYSSAKSFEITDGNLNTSFSQPYLIEYSVNTIVPAHWEYYLQ